jgi:hypothetical protein
MVQGTVANADGYETGVTVNGVIASVSGNLFEANHIPLQEGMNVITATATDIHGTSSINSSIVNAAAKETYVRLTADCESGVAPLLTTLRVDGTFSIATSSISATGPVQPQIMKISENEYKTTMTNEGTYYFTVSVTGPDLNVYQDTIAVTVANKDYMDSFLAGKWQGMKTKLINNDISGALSYVMISSRQLYSDLFASLSSQLSNIAQNMQDIQLISIADNHATYRIRKNESYCGQTQTITYYIYFAVDKDGLWKIKKF